MMLKDIKAKYAVVEGLKIRYLDIGKGEPILFLHGLSGRIETWVKQIPYFVENGFRVISLDIPPHGGSDKPVRVYSLSYLSRIIIGLLDLLGIEKTIVVGHSMGGVITLTLAMLYPKRVKIAISLSASPGVTRRPRFINIVVFGLLIVRGLFRKMYAWIEYGSQYKKIMVSPLSEYLLYMAHLAYKGIVTFPHLQYYGLLTGISKGMWNYIERINMPVAIVMGDRDEFFSAADIPDIAKRNKNITPVILHGVGHNLFELEDLNSRIHNIIKILEKKLAQ
ncbi:MAG: alpha/beta hydrolase [Candidatus Korarchaeota archaeon]